MRGYGVRASVGPSARVRCWEWDPLRRATLNHGGHVPAFPTTKVEERKRLGYSSVEHLLRAALPSVASRHAWNDSRM